MRWQRQPDRVEPRDEEVRAERCARGAHADERDEAPQGELAPQPTHQVSPPLALVVHVPQHAGRHLGESKMMTARLESPGTHARGTPRPGPDVCSPTFVRLRHSFGRPKFGLIFNSLKLQRATRTDASHERGSKQSIARAVIEERCQPRSGRRCRRTCCATGASPDVVLPPAMPPLVRHRPRAAPRRRRRAAARSSSRPHAQRTRAAAAHRTGRRMRPRGTPTCGRLATASRARARTARPGGRPASPRPMAARRQATATRQQARARVR